MNPGATTLPVASIRARPPLRARLAEAMAQAAVADPTVPGTARPAGPIDQRPGGDQQVDGIRPAHAALHAVAARRCCPPGQ